ncbi:sphingolipid delta(4)-desaturase/C4-hydroxylase DES2-like isoform X2 [Biomphalaria glabrata]|nr:sphingolipid delta(4)-desaturase/C4-hydroxylase DES2-like isoform X2 [Biomphalaria glabrata]
MSTITKMNGHANGMNGIKSDNNHVTKTANGKGQLAKAANGNHILAKTANGNHSAKTANGNHNAPKKDIRKILKIPDDPFKWFNSFITLKTKIENDEDYCMYTGEPHTGRRQEILDKHPEIKSLMGPDIWIVVPTSICVISQFILCWLLKDASWPFLLFMAYCIGGVFNHSLGSAIHEIGHNLAFGHGRLAWMNRVLSLWCNLPIGVPMAITYKKYHADHHRYLGEEYQDVDIPTRLESWLFKRPVTKMIWLIFHPILHSIRPFYKSPKPLTGWETINTIVQFAYDILIFQLFGIKPVVYMVAGTLMALGLHPLAGHFISEHYLFTAGQATHSYYGPLNFILYNVGYHNEHHDFPYIAYTRLPELKRIAPEYYDNLPYHSSWIKVVWDFIFDDNMGPHAHGVGFVKKEML